MVTTFGLVAGLCVFLALRLRIEVAKLYHFDRDPGGVFRMMSRGRTEGRGSP